MIDQPCEFHQIAPNAVTSPGSGNSSRCRKCRGDLCRSENVELARDLRYGDPRDYDDEPPSYGGPEFPSAYCDWVETD